jgi:guanine deaminase
MSNLRLGSGVAPLHQMRVAGVGLGIGTDASNTSDGQNMFEAMRLAATLSRAATSDPGEWVSARAAFVMATEGSAALMSLNNVGRIATGWAADLVLLDRNYCHYTPLRRALDQVVLAENGAAVREVIIDGRTVFAEGRMQTIDEAALAVRAHAAADRIDHATRAARTTAEAAAMVVQSFCSRHCAARLPFERI